MHDIDHVFISERIERMKNETRREKREREKSMKMKVEESPAISISRIHLFPTPLHLPLLFSSSSFPFLQQTKKWVAVVG